MTMLTGLSRSSGRISPPREDATLFDVSEKLFLKLRDVAESRAPRVTPTSLSRRPDENQKNDRDQFVNLASMWSLFLMIPVAHSK